MKVLTIFRLYQKTTPQICLILHQFNLYILLICIKRLVNIRHFLSCHLNGPFSTIFKIWAKFAILSHILIPQKS